MGSTQLAVKARPMREEDLDRVLAIEAECFERPRSADEMVRELSPWNRHASVAEFAGRVVGFAVHELRRRHIHLWCVGVHPEHRRLFVGSQLVAPILKKLSAVACTRITADAWDDNLTGHLFLKSMGFKATDVHRGEGLGRDYYSFRATWLNRKLKGAGVAS